MKSFIIDQNFKPGSNREIVYNFIEKSILIKMDLFYFCTGPVFNISLPKQIIEDIVKKEVKRVELIVFFKSYHP